MPIALPPPLPPAQGEVQQAMPGAASLAVIPFGDYRVHVLGPAYLRHLRLRATVAAAASLSDAVRGLAAAAYAGGYPATQVLYSIAGQDLFVLLAPGAVSRVEGDARLLPFFRELAAARPLTAASFEQARTLASLHADRLGLDVKPTLQPDGAGGQMLRLDATPVADTGALRAGIGNPGNRFVGRRFAALDASYANDAGDEFAAGVQRALGDSAGSFVSQSLQWSRAHPAGVFGTSAQHASFTQAAPATDNALWQVQGQWLYPVYADFVRRWTVQLALDHVDRSAEVAEGVAGAFRERYFVAAAATGYLRTLYPFEGAQLDLESGVELRQGFGDAGDSRSGADPDFFLVRPTLAATLLPGGGGRLRLEASGQRADRSVPEQQQWTLGGVNSLAAFLPGVAVGDSAIQLRLDGRWDALPLGPIRVAPRLFVEYGAARLQQVPPGGNAARAQTAADAGAALEFSVGNWLSAGLVAALPFAERNIDEPVLQESRARYFFSLQFSWK